MDEPHQTRRAPRAFVSHAHEDKQHAELLARELRALGVDAWLDKWEILPGDSLIQRIFEEGLRDCDVFVILLSPASQRSRWVREELDTALIKRIEGSTRVVPVRLEECDVPTALRALMWVDFDDMASKRIADVVLGVREIPPVAPSPALLQTEVAGLSRLGGQLAIHLASNLDSGRGTATTTSAASLCKELQLTADEINDAVEELESNGIVEVYRYIGTAPFTFGHVKPTYALAHALRGTPALTYDAEEDVLIVANAVVSRRVLDGRGVMELTNLPAARINDAVEFLEDRGLVRVLRVMGAGPFRFMQVEATGATRRFVANNK